MALGFRHSLVACSRRIFLLLMNISTLQTPILLTEICETAARRFIFASGVCCAAICSETVCFTCNTVIFCFYTHSMMRTLSAAALVASAAAFDSTGPCFFAAAAAVSAPFFSTGLLSEQSVPVTKQWFSVTHSFFDISSNQSLIKCLCFGAQSLRSE